MYNWGAVPTDDELRAMVNDEWLNERIKELGTRIVMVD